MHILQAQNRRIDDGGDAVDLAQSPGDIVILSAADTEISGFAAACNTLQGSLPDIRIASLLALSHPYSIDLYVEQTLVHAKVVLVRLLGGRNYWTYGVERLEELARTHGTQVVFVSGDTNWDADLSRSSNVDEEVAHALWGYCAEGGAANWCNALRMLHAIALHQEPSIDPPKPLPKAGLYWPGLAQPSLDVIRESWLGQATAAIVFYRSTVQAGSTAPIDVLITALREKGVDALPVYVSSLKDGESIAVLEHLFAEVAPSIVLNGTAFAVSKAGQEHTTTVLDRPGRAVLQFVMSGSSEEGWAESDRGLTAKDLTMHVVLPELDGRVLTQVVSFKEEGEPDPLTECKPVRFVPKINRIDRLAEQAARLAKLRMDGLSQRRIAIILSNYPNKDSRIANGVGLDTPASAINLMEAMESEGYDLVGRPGDAKALMDLLQRGPTNAFDERRLRAADETVSLEKYLSHFNALPVKLQEQIHQRWGEPKDDPYCLDDLFRLPFHRWGKVVVGIQPARGYNIDPKETYHDPALVPPHNYLAAYFWLREEFGAEAIVHLGKHGNLEWLPGKALALSDHCWPDVLMQGVPLIYPFIVNDPGEGAQAKRRSSAVIIDHLMPAMTRAETYGPLAEIESLIDEYFLALGVDAKRVGVLENEIFEAISRHHLSEELGLTDGFDRAEALQRLDGYICELKELQIRDGLHILGKGPIDAQRTDTLVALSRVPGADGHSLHRAITRDLGLIDFDPLNCTLEAEWPFEKVPELAEVSDNPWRTVGDTVERLENFAKQIMERGSAPKNWEETEGALRQVQEEIAPRLDRSGANEIDATLDALRGSFVAPGPSGAPTRGRLDCLPTGRNFYAVDVRAVPTPTAWQLGRRSAELVVERYFQEEGEWPKNLAMTAWGTSNMRTGGDDIAQALALIGVKPVWESVSGRVTGFEVVPLQELKRPRVDVTLRISGFFRDAFPHQIDLFDSAVQAIANLDEPEDANPVSAQIAFETKRLCTEGHEESSARILAGYRIFGSKPGAYGAGLQALIDEQIWDHRSDFADSFINWGGYAYGSGVGGARADVAFSRRLGATDVVLQNQDNREHDILDSDDYYQFQGGLTAAVATYSGEEPRIYHGDHSRPEFPKIRSLEEELARVVRGRAANPKWINGMMRHGYKGAFEMAATLDYLFAYAATTRAVKDHQFELLYDAYIADEAVRSFIAEHNPTALSDMEDRFNEAIDRGLWQPRRNSILAALAAAKGEALA